MSTPSAETYDDQNGQPATYLTVGAGGSSLSWSLPPGVEFDLEAVYVTIDASAAGSDVTAEVTITDPSGVVIAKKPQGDTIPAGGSGSATFALRLDDSGAGASSAGLHWGVNTDTGALGLVLNGAGAFDFETGGSAWVNGTSGGAYTLSTAQGNITLESLGADIGQLIKLQSGGQITLLANSQLLLEGNSVIVDGTNNVQIQGATVQTFGPNIEEKFQLGTDRWRVADAAGTSLLEVTGAPTLKAGTALDMQSHKITNLAAGVAASDAATVSQIPGAAPVSSVFGRTGAVVAVDGDYYGVEAAALTGATQASRYVGATASGAPVSGTFAVGDFVIDRTGSVWICTVAGSPGTFVNAGVAGGVASINGGGGALTGAVTFSGTGGISLSQVGQNIAINAGGGGVANVQKFAANGSWTMPTGCTAVDVICVGAGGGGGGGPADATSARPGGSGGGGGAVTRAMFRASDLSSPVTVTVGGGGTGGPGKPAGSNGSGSDGNNGGASTFGTLLTAGGGGGGKGGGGTGVIGGAGGGTATSANLTTVGTPGATSATVSSGIAGQGCGSTAVGNNGGSTEFGGAGGGGGTSSPAAALGGSSIFGGAGGGCGGGLNASQDGIAGARGGLNQAYSAGGGAAGGTPPVGAGAGNPGNDGASTPTPYCGGGGGGGSGAKRSGGSPGPVAGGKGGDGKAGGGGGGGGAGTGNSGAGNPGKGGDGGNGGDGYVLVVAW